MKAIKNLITALGGIVRVVSNVDDANLINDFTRWTFQKYIFLYFGLAIAVQSQINAGYKSVLFLAENTFRYTDRKKECWSRLILFVRVRRQSSFYKRLHNADSLSRSHQNGVRLHIFYKLRDRKETLFSNCIVRISHFLNCNQVIVWYSENYKFHNFSNIPRETQNVSFFYQWKNLIANK